MKGGLVLVILMLVSFSSASYDFCNNGEKGSGLDILSVKDNLDGNSGGWIWDWNDEVEIQVEVENNLGKDDDFVIEFIFLDENENEGYVVVDNGDLKKEFGLNQDEKKIISFNFQVEDHIYEGKYSLYIKFHVDGQEIIECVEAYQTIKIGSKVFCENGEVADVFLRVFNIVDENLDNEDDWRWSVGDDIRVSLAVENGNYSSTDFNVELIFVNEKGEIVSFASDPEDLKDIVDIKEDYSSKVVFDFDVTEGVEGGVYGFYVVVVLEDDEDICTSVRADGNRILGIEVGENIGVIVVSVFGPTNILAGSFGDYTVAVKNLGVSNEERVSVFAYNYNLGIDEEHVIYDLASGESREIIIPIHFFENISVVSGSISFFAQYDYDEDKGVYLSWLKESDYGRGHTVNIATSELIVVDEVGSVVGQGNESLEGDVKVADSTTDYEEDIESGFSFLFYFSIAVVLAVCIAAYFFLGRFFKYILAVLVAAYSILGRLFEYRFRRGY